MPNISFYLCITAIGLKFETIRAQSLFIGKFMVQCLVFVYTIIDDLSQKATMLIHDEQEILGIITMMLKRESPEPSIEVIRKEEKTNVMLGYL